MEIAVRHAESDDYQAMHRIMSAPKVAAGTLQLSLQSAEAWRKRLAEPPEGLFLLLACVDGEVIGTLGLETFPNRPRVRHTGSLGMAVRDDWQGRGVGAKPPAGLFEPHARVLVDHKGEKLLVAEGRVEAHTAHGDEIIDPTGRAGAGQGR